MELPRLFSRRSVIATVGALVARIVWRGTRRVEAAGGSEGRRGDEETGDWQRLAVGSAENAAVASGQVTYYRYDRFGRLVQVVSPPIGEVKRFTFCE
jgi:hypothetical protein